MGCLAALHGGLSSADHLVVGIYLVLMLWMGIAIARRQRSTDDFFVGGRNLPAWAVGISLLASLLSTITYLGMPGEMFRSGVGFLTRQLGVPLVLVVVWFVWIPFFMRLRLTSAYEYLERRFDYPTRALAAVLCLLLILGWMAVVVLTASKAMAEIAQLNLSWFFGTNADYPDADVHFVIVSIGLFSVLYTTLGGIRAVVWTDVIQFFILIGGALFTMGAVAWKTGSGVGDWLATSAAYKHEQVEWFSWDVGNRSTIAFIATAMFFWFICTHGANQVALQRYFAVKDVWAARRSYLISAVASFGLGVILAGVGISLMHFVQQEAFELPARAGLDSADAALRNESQDKIFPQFISFYLPGGFRGMVVAALFAAAMSTIDSGANSVSTIVTVDFFRRLSSGDTSAARELKLARILTATMGLVIISCTVFLYHLSKGTDLITLCQKGFNCFLGPLGALFVLGMFAPRVTGVSAIPAVLVGELVGIVTSYSEEMLGTPFSTHLVIPTSWLATLVAAALFALILGTRASEEQRQWMWIPIVRGGKKNHGDTEARSAVVNQE